jgi:radical SAM protein with 4Fe4S-binding SPASM domain
MKFEGFPLIIGWELTLQCNLRCRHCGSIAGAPRENELTTKEALSICDQFPDLLVEEVDFTGGERFLRPDLPVIARKLQELGISTTILTHGIGYSAEKITQLKEMGISAVGISLDGLENTHDYIRKKKGAFASVLDMIHLLEKADLPFNVITTVNSKNIRELPELHQKLQMAHVQNWRLQVIMPLGRAKENNELQISETELRLLGLFIQQQNRNGKSSLKIICSDGLQYILPNDISWTGCGAGIITCGITADGKVKGCLSMPDELIEGDLRRNSLWEIWFHPQSFAYNRNFKPQDLGSNCQDCEKAVQCMGGCSSSSYASTKQFHNDPACFYRVSDLIGSKQNKL